MPFAFGNQPTHDSSQHIGSAARNAANGVCALNTWGAAQPLTMTKSQFYALGAAGEGGSIYMENSGYVFLASNAVKTTTGWERIDIATEANLLGISILGTITRYRASAGANPITWDLLSGTVVSDQNGKFAGLLNTDNAFRSVKIGNTTKNTADATGNQAITGIGFTPRLLELKIEVGGTSQMSIGEADGTIQQCIYDQSASLADTWTAATVNCGYLIQTAAIFSAVTLVSFDADGFTLGWTKTGAKTGTATILYKAWQ